MFTTFAARLVGAVIELVTEELFLPEQIDWTDLERVYELIPAGASR